MNLQEHDLCLTFRVVWFQGGLEVEDHLVLFDSMGHHLSAARLQSFVGKRFKTHPSAVVGGCL